MKYDYQVNGGNSFDVTATGNFKMGFISAHIRDGTAFVERVALRHNMGTVADAATNASFQAFVNGNPLFTNDVTANQSAGASYAVEELTPQQNRYFSDPLAEVDFSVTAADASAGASMAATITVDIQ